MCDSVNTDIVKSLLKVNSKFTNGYHIWVFGVEIHMGRVSILNGTTSQIPDESYRPKRVFASFTGMTVFVEENASFHMRFADWQKLFVLSSYSHFTAFGLQKALPAVCEVLLLPICVLNVRLYNGGIEVQIRGSMMCRVYIC